MGRTPRVRRGPFVFDRRARYGAALVGTLFAAYLTIAIDFTAYLQSANYQGTITTDVPLVNVIQFLTILVVYIISFAIAPSASWRRLLAVAWSVVVLCLWAAFGILRARGVIDQPPLFWSFVLNQGWVALLVALGGWTLVRDRHPIALVVVVIAIAPPLVTRALVDSAVPSGILTLVLQGTVIVCGIGAAWLAALLDRAARLNLRWESGGRPARPASSGPRLDPTATGAADRRTHEHQ